jgi:peptide deformylase
MGRKRDVLPMIRPLVHNDQFLSIPSTPAGKEDLAIVRDLTDTLKAHRSSCVGMAANMIGVLKRIIVFDDQGTLMVMFNPEIVRKKDRYNTQEGCLSLEGVRPTQRWHFIKVRYQTEQLQTRFKTYNGWTARIIQHEIDHCNGVLI